MKNNPISAAPSAAQQALDLQLIRAVKNPRGEAQDENGLTQTVAELLARGADVNAKISNGSTALISAAGNGHTEIVAELLNREADVNAKTSDGFSALISAAGNGHTKTVAELLNREADVNAKTSNGSTALMLAAGNGHTEIVPQLLSRGADVNLKSPDDATVLIIAAENGHTEIVSALLSHVGIDVEAESDGYTALMLSAKKGHTETVLALLSRDGVDWQIVQDQLRHPALRNLNTEVSLLLAITLPEGELRNSIIESFNQRNPNSPINQENNDILGAGPKAYKTLKDLKSWHKRYLIDPIDPDSGLGLSEHEAEILANQRFFDLLNRQDARQEALARNDLITALVSESASLAINSGLGDQEALGPVRELNPEDFYTLTTKIIDSGKDESGIPKLKDSLVVAALRKDRTDQASASPAPIMTRGSTVSIAEPILAPRKNGGCCVVS